MINYKFSGLSTCFRNKKATYNTKNAARGPHLGASRAECGPRAGRFPGLIYYQYVISNLSIIDKSETEKNQSQKLKFAANTNFLA
jgi:hypothetical protein